MKNKIDYLKSTLNDNEVFDEKTRHKLTETKSGEIIEMKYCTKCDKWHPLADFHKHGHTVDGLSTICRDCVHSAYRKPKSEISKTSSKDSQPVDNSDIENYFDSLKQIQSQLSALLSENTELKQVNAKLVDENKFLRSKETCTTERDVITYLGKHWSDHKIPLRLLFSAIHSNDPRYQFFYIDAETGCTASIKYES